MASDVKKKRDRVRARAPEGAVMGEVIGLGERYLREMKSQIDLSESLIKSLPRMTGNWAVMDDRFWRSLPKQLEKIFPAPLNKRIAWLVKEMKREAEPKQMKAFLDVICKDRSAFELGVIVATFHNELDFSIEYWKEEVAKGKTS